MKVLKSVLCAAVMGAVSLPVFAADNAKLAERLSSGQETLQQIMGTPDKGIPNEILSGAQCVVVIPHYKKGAFVVGAEYGQGEATCRTGHGWSAPVFVKLEGGSFGWQIGGQSTDLVLVVMNKDGLQHMLSSKFKIGGDASASAGPVGRDAQAGTDWKLNSEILTYSRSKGLFAGIDLTGTVLEKNADDMREFYGSDLPFNQVLTGGVPTPAAARPFVSTVAHYFVRSRQ